MIDITWADERLNEMRVFYDRHEPEIFYMSHYEIAKIKDNPYSYPSDWKVFLTDPRVSEYINQELRLLQQVEVNKLLRGISARANSVGTGQTLNALLKMAETTAVKEGPVFVYSYIPLSAEELNAPSVHILPDDPFRQS